MRAAQGVGGHFRQTDALDLALAHQVGQRADTVFDRHFLVPSMQVIQIDDIGAQALQAVFASALDGFRPTIDCALTALVENPAFAG